MSYNIDSIEVLRSTLRISKGKVKKALKLELPSALELESLEFDAEGFASLKKFWFHGECSGRAEHDGRLEAFVALTVGEADMVLTWEGGESHSGLRIRDGKMERCEVTMTLAPSKKFAD